MAEITGKRVGFFKDKVLHISSVIFSTSGMLSSLFSFHPLSHKNTQTLVQAQWARCCVEFVAGTHTHTHTTPDAFRKTQTFCCLAVTFPSQKAID